MDSNLKKQTFEPTPMQLFLAAILLQALLAYFVPDPALMQGRVRLIGLLPIVSGLMLTIVAERQFRAAGTAVCPHQKATLLVRRGCFGYSRNPMYLGLIAVLAGIGILLGAVAAVAVAALFAAVLALYFVPREEAMLSTLFGKDYAEYSQQVRRWL